MIPGIALPPTATLKDIISAIYEIYRRAIDGTTKPLFVDITNQRVIVGGVATTGNNSAFQVQSGDIEITTAAKGIILKDDGGSGKTVRITPTYDSETGNWTLSFTTVS